MGTLLGDQDLAFHDARAREVVRLAGTKSITYYMLQLDRSPRDPLYDEPLEEVRGFDPNDSGMGVQMNGLIEYPEGYYKSGEEGQRTEYDAVLWLCRKDFEETFPSEKNKDGYDVYATPRIGDVVEVQGKFFDVLQIQLEGQLNDTTAVHTMWYLKLKHRTEFDAIRRVEGKV